MKNIIFDLDGTLLDSMPVWKNVGTLFLKKQGITPPDNLRNIIKKLTIPEAAQYFISTFHLPNTQNEVLDSIIGIVADQYRHSIQLKPFALEFLKKQHAAGSRMCILTASESSYIQAALERLELFPYFEFIMTCTEVGLTKNNPIVYHKAMERLNGTLENTIVFEDALYAIKSAREGGFFVVAIEDSAAEQEKSQIVNLCSRYIASYAEVL